MKWFSRLRSRGEEASCREVMRRLQFYLDGELDEVAVRRIAAHLEHCRRCGLETEIYEELKLALRRGGALEAEPLERLRDFGQRVAAGEVDAGEGTVLL